MLRALDVPQKADVREMCALLGVLGEPDAPTRALCEEAWARLRPYAAPKMVSAQLPAAQLRSLVKGNDLTRHLAGCEEVVLFAVTLGAGADRALRRAQMGSVAMAAAMDAAASAMAEGCAAQAHALLRRSARERGLWLTQRFSPGYGDCPLSLQPALLRLLDAPRAIGLTATKDDLLLPRKSVTAICGQADHPVTGFLAGCEHCALRAGCRRRHEGRPCNGLAE